MCSRYQKTSFLNFCRHTMSQNTQQDMNKPVKRILGRHAYEHVCTCRKKATRHLLQRRLVRRCTSVGRRTLGQVNEFLEVASSGVDNIDGVKGDRLKEPPDAHGHQEVSCLAQYVQPGVVGRMVKNLCLS